MSNLVWGFDVSYYQSKDYDHTMSDLDRFPLDEMRKHGCRFGIVKTSMQLSKDQAAVDHTTLIHQAGMQTGGYHWCDPIGNYPLQANLFESQIEKLQPDIQAFDVEQYWAIWQEFYDKDIKKILSEDKIVDNFLYLYGELTGYLSHPLIYTANWFTYDYVKTRYADLNVCDLWVAYYTKARWYVLKYLTSDWRLITWSQFNELLEYLATVDPLLPQGFSTYKIWQFDSKTILPGCPYAIDLNLFNGTEAEYEAWLGLQQEPEPPVEPPSPDVIAEVWEAIEELRGNMVKKEDLVKMEIVNPVIVKWLDGE